MRTALICQDDGAAGREVFPAWLGSFSDLVAVVLIEDPPAATLRRLRAEARRSGLRLLDVFAFRAYYRVRFARRDSRLIAAKDRELTARYAAMPEGVEILRVSDANAPAVRELLLRTRPDVTLARCKTLLRPEVFDVPVHGTVVVHPGVCPEYRNAHGCFWALARRDLGRVGATMLRIDAGVDTGPVLGYYAATFDEVRDTHITIQHAVVLDNLDAIAADLQAHVSGELAPVDTTGRQSRAWGQPRLSDWRRWKHAARRRVRSAAVPTGDAL